MRYPSGLHVRQPRIAQHIGTLEPFERAIAITAHAIVHRDLDAGALTTTFNERVQCAVCFGQIALAKMQYAKGLREIPIANGVERVQRNGAFGMAHRFLRSTEHVVKPRRLF